jgi:hypothetical protein
MNPVIKTTLRQLNNQNNERDNGRDNGRDKEKEEWVVASKAKGKSNTKSWQIHNISKQSWTHTNIANTVTAGNINTNTIIRIPSIDQNSENSNTSSSIEQISASNNTISIHEKHQKPKNSKKKSDKSESDRSEFIISEIERIICEHVYVTETAHIIINVFPYINEIIQLINSYGKGDNVADQIKKITANHIIYTNIKEIEEKKKTIERKEIIKNVDEFVNNVITLYNLSDNKLEIDKITQKYLVTSVVRQDFKSAADCVNEILNWCVSNNIKENENAVVIRPIVRSWAHEILIQVINGLKPSNIFSVVVKPEGYHMSHWVAWNELVIMRNANDALQTLSMLFSVDSTTCIDTNRHGETLLGSLRKARSKNQITQNEFDILYDRIINIDDIEMAQLCRIILNKITPAKTEVYADVLNYIAIKNPHVFCEEFITEQMSQTLSFTTTDKLFQIINDKIMAIKKILAIDPSNSKEFGIFFANNNWSAEILTNFAQTIVDICIRLNKERNNDVYGALIGLMYEQMPEIVSNIMNLKFSEGQHSFAIICMRHTNIIDYQLMSQLVNQIDTFPSNIRFMILDIVGHLAWLRTPDRILTQKKTYQSQTLKDFYKNTNPKNKAGIDKNNAINRQVISYIDRTFDIMLADEKKKIPSISPKSKEIEKKNRIESLSSSSLSLSAHNSSNKKVNNNYHNHQKKQINKFETLSDSDDELVEQSKSTNIVHAVCNDNVNIDIIRAIDTLDDDAIVSFIDNIVANLNSSSNSKVQSFDQVDNQIDKYVTKIVKMTNNAIDHEQFISDLSFYRVEDNEQRMNQSKLIDSLLLSGITILSKENSIKLFKTRVLSNYPKVQVLNSFKDNWPEIKDVCQYDNPMYGKMFIREILCE